ncbi:MAG: hypothetical protein ACRDX8_07935 [Acidimicrobiales bacterium]
MSGLIEVAVTWWRERALTYPASAIQTGLSIALIFRVSSTGRALASPVWTLTLAHDHNLALVELGLTPGGSGQRRGISVIESGESPVILSSIT